MNLRHCTLLALGIFSSVQCGLFQNKPIIKKSTVFETLLNDTKSDLNKLAKTLFEKNKKSGSKLSQTEAHLLRHAVKKISSLRLYVSPINYLAAFETDPILRQAAHEIITIEQAEAAKGNYTLLHGQPWLLHFLQELYGFLWQEVTGLKLDNFVFMRFKRLYQPSIKHLEAKLAKHKERLAYYMAYGTPQYYYHCANGKQNQNYFLFTNLALFNNQYGSSTARYIAKGDAENGYSPKLSAKKMFKNLGLQAYFAAFEHELQDLLNEHSTLTKNPKQQYGHGLVISFPAALVDKLSYISWTGIKKQFAVTSKKTSALVKEVLDALRTNPYNFPDYTNMQALHIDRNEFTVVLSLDGALKPTSGVHIYSIAPVAPQKMAAYATKRDELFARIAKSIRTSQYGAINKAYWQQAVKLLY